MTTPKKQPTKLTMPTRKQDGSPAAVAERNEPKPGTRAFNEAQTAATGHPGVPDSYTNEAIAQSNENKLAPTPGLKLIQDEWYGQIEMGNPFQETGKPYADANPDKHFRFLGDAMIKGRGKRGYQVFNDPQTGKPVVVAGMTLAFIPMSVKEEKERRLAEKTNAQRRQTREEYDRATNQLAKDSEGQLLATGQITETVGHRRAAI